jgi:hypothetical protein
MVPKEDVEPDKWDDAALDWFDEPEDEEPEDKQF